MIRRVQRRHLLLLGLMALNRSRPVRAGQTASAYRRRELRARDGQATSLAQAAHDTRLLVVVMKSVHCQVCIAQLRRLEALSSELRRFGVTVVGLVHDSFQECDRVGSRERLDSALLSDPSRKVLQALGLWRDDLGHPMPAVLLFDRCGAERGRLVGRRPSERPEPAIVKLLRAVERDPERCRQPNA